MRQLEFAFMDHRLRTIWRGIKRRCLCPTHRNFGDYGGRGVRIATEWVASFDAFKAWAIANGYTDSLELDRRETDGHYEPTNCRWVTHSQQMQNRRKCAPARSRFKGVQWRHDRKKWRVLIKANGRSFHGGTFTSEIEAAKRYDALAAELHGEFARPNFRDKS